ncbi:MAG: 50S ribosomal protein L29 [Bacteroidia bacterium]|nr:MAG: 50S ribosomal protein L29 [Bacteroidia bacterium]
MKNSEIKELSTAELVERIEIETNDLAKMEMNHIISPIENPLLIRKSRRTIARLKTELNARKLQEKA